jgi:hypothetical protein
MTAKEYIEQFGDKIELNYKNYEPKKEILEDLTRLLMSKNQGLKVLVLGAEWCPDCNKNVPQMIKIIRNMKMVKIEFKILYGIMKNAFHKPNEPIWHKTRSPPEAVDPKFDLTAIPTFYYFNSSGKLLDVIVENPKPQSTLEEEMLAIFKRNQ